MSRISQDFINNIGYLYEEMSIQENDFLNEESQYYDEETTEIVEDILSTISVSMVYEGYSVEGIIGFLADSSEQDIIEKYLSFDENILIESVVSEDYIVEQLEIFDVAIEEGIGSLIGKVAQGAARLAGRVASKPARVKVANKIMASKNPERLVGSASRVSAGGKTLDPTGAVERLARMKLNKAGMPSDMTKKVLDNSPNIGTKTSLAAFAPTMGKVVKGVQKVQAIASKAKAALPGIAKGVGIFGLGAGGGYVGAKMAGAGSGGGSDTTGSDSSTESPGISGSPRETDTPSSGSPSSESPSSGGNTTSRSPSSTSTKTTIPGSSKQTGNRVKDMETWAKAHPDLAAKLNPGGSQRGTDKSKMEKDAEEIRDMIARSKQRQGEQTGSSTGSDRMQQDVETKKKENQKNPPNEKNTNESYEPYDILLDYLIVTGHADTIEEAHYIMLEMDETAVCTIIEAYNDYVLAEEVSEWVDNLLGEGYDLSQYTWDDIIEYYVSGPYR